MYVLFALLYGAREIILTARYDRNIPRSSLFWNVAQLSLAISYRRFATGHRFHLQKSSLTLQDETDRLSRTLVTKYQSQQRNIPEERRTSFTSRRKTEITQVHFELIKVRTPLRIRLRIWNFV